MTAKRTKIRRRKRPTRAYLLALAQARLELIFRDVLQAKRYDLAFAAVMAQCRLNGFTVDGPGRPEQAPAFSSEAWQKLLADAEQRRDS